MSGRSVEDGEQRPDSGATLIELVVAMGIFTTVLAIFMATVVVLSGMTTKTQNLSDTTSTVRNAYLRLDRDVRYADALTVPGSVGGDWFVEARIPAVGSSAAQCVQWRYHKANASLQVRRWAQGSTSLPSWTVLAGSLAIDPSLDTDPSRAPFVRTAAGSTPTTGPGVPLAQQQIAVHFLASRGSGTRASSTALDTAFIARNSSYSSPGNSDTTGATTNLCGDTSSIRTTS